MAIVEYTEHWQGAGSTSDQENGTTTRVYDVIVDGSNAPFEHLLIERSLIFPTKFDVHPGNSFLFVDNKSATPNPGPNKFLLTVSYGSIGDPLQVPAQIDWLHAGSLEPIDRDFDGNAITNSSGETPDPPLTEDVEDIVFRAVYNTATFDAGISSLYKGAVNSDVWFGFPIETAKVITFSGSRKASETVPYWEITQETQIRQYDTWAKRYLDQGFRIKQDVNGITGLQEYETIKDSNGDPLSQPVLLDGNGQQLKAVASPVFITIWTKPRLPFGGVILQF